MTEIKKCIYCEKTSKEVALAGDGVNHICKECVNALTQAMNDVPAKKAGDSTTALSRFLKDETLKPSSLKAILDKSIVSQEQAKKQCSYAVYEHLKRKAVFEELGCDAAAGLHKPNLLLLGSTGVGKTEISRILSQTCDIPMHTVDCTSLTEAGYVGDSVDDIIRSLLTKANDNIADAEWGIVFLDEVDKLRSRHSNSTTADVGGQGVQDALLKMIEGTEVRVQANSGRKTSGHQQSIVNTSNILFIASGAFTGIDSELVGSETTSEIGFLKNDKPAITEEEKLNSYSKVKPKDLVKHGMSPEFIGRFSTLVPFRHLSKDDLISILNSSDISVLKKVKYSLSFEGTELVFDTDALETVAEKAAELKVGARSLSQIIYKTLEDVVYDSANKPLGKIVVTKELVLEKNKGTENE